MAPAKKTPKPASAPESAPKQIAGHIFTIRGLVTRVKLQPGFQPNVHDLLALADKPEVVGEVRSFNSPEEIICVFLTSAPGIIKGAALVPLSRPVSVPVGKTVLGRMFNALGQPIDGQGSVPGVQLRPVYYAGGIGEAVAHPEVLETGIKAIDFFTPFVKGRKIGIIGGAGVGKTVLITELMRNVSRDQSKLSFFVGIGERIREGQEMYQSMQERNALSNAVLYLGQMNENPALRSLVGHSAAAVAEYFRDEEKRDILFFIDNAYRFVQAGNEVAAMLGDVPSEGGYQATMFSDLHRFEDRLYSSAQGSITTVQTVYVPADDLTDPAVVEIQQQLDSVIVLSRQVAEAGIRPAIDLVKTSSMLLTPDIVGDRHYLLSAQVQNILQKHENLKNIVAIVGESELSVADKTDYHKAEKLIQFFVQEPSVAEVLTGVKGQYYTREQTLGGVEEILLG